MPNLRRAALMAGGVFGHRDLNVILGPMSMDGVMNQRRTHLERGKVAPMDWPPRLDLSTPESSQAVGVTSAGVPMCKRHAQLGNFDMRPLNRLHPKFCAVHEF